MSVMQAVAVTVAGILLAALMRWLWTKAWKERWWE